MKATVIKTTNRRFTLNRAKLRRVVQAAYAKTPINYTDEKADETDFIPVIVTKRPFTKADVKKLKK